MGVGRKGAKPELTKGVDVCVCVMWFQGLVYGAGSTFSSGMVLMCMWCDFRVWLTVLIPMEVGWWRYWSWLDSSPSSTQTPEHMQSILCFWHGKNNGEGKVWFQVWQLNCPHSVVRWLQFVEDSCSVGCLNYGWLTLWKLNSSVLPWNLPWAVGLQTCYRAFICGKQGPDTSLCKFHQHLLVKR